MNWWEEKEDNVWGRFAPRERNKMKGKFYTRYLLLNTLLLILSLAFWLVISDLYMKCFVLTSLYIFSEVALLRIMCDDKKVYISRLLLVTVTMVVYAIVMTILFMKVYPLIFEFCENFPQR